MYILPISTRPIGYKISGEGDGGVAGFAENCTATTVTLTEKDGGTLLTYNVEAQIGGKLAQLGRRLVSMARPRKPPMISSRILPRLDQPSGGLT